MNMRSNKIERGAVFFDFDGVIADTFDVAKIIVARYAKYKKVKCPSDDTILNSSSREMIHMLNIYWWELPLAAYLSRVWAKEIQPVAQLFPFSGDLLDQAKQSFGDYWIISSNSPERILTSLRHNNIECNKGNIIGNIGFFGKDRIIKKLVNVNNFLPDRVILIGDETRDIIAAKKAGVKSAAVTWGFQSKAVLERQNPDYLLDNLEECKAIINTFATAKSK